MKTHYYTLESKVGILQNPQIYMLGRGQKLEDAIQEKPISLAVAVTEEPGDKPRMVIFGDTEFITNFEIARSPTAAVNYSFVVSSIEWLAGREDLIGPQPRESDKFCAPRGRQLRPHDLSARLDHVPGPHRPGDWRLDGPPQVGVAASGIDIKR